MDISFILSANELFTLMSLIPDHTDAGRRFSEDALSDAEMCGLDELVEKKLAKYGVNGQMEFAPVIRMVIDSLARANNIERLKDGWLAHSSWVVLYCEGYPYKKQHYKITPLKEGV